MLHPTGPCVHQHHFAAYGCQLGAAWRSKLWSIPFRKRIRLRSTFRSTERGVAAEILPIRAVGKVAAGSGWGRRDEASLPRATFSASRHPPMSSSKPNSCLLEE